MLKRILSIILVLCLVLGAAPAVSYADDAQSTLRYTVLVLDASGSMSGDPINALVEAAKKFVAQVLSAPGENYVGIVSYNYDASIVADFTNDQATLNTRLYKLYARGLTNPTDGLRKAKMMFENNAVASTSSGAIKNILLLSDGLPTSGPSKYSGRYSSSDYHDYEYANPTYDLATQMHSEYNISTLGFFHDLTGEFLEFGKRFLDDLDNAGYYDVTDIDDLEFTFGQVADDINNGGGSTDHRGSKYMVIRIACPVDVEIARNGAVLSSKSSNYNTATSFGKLEFEGADSDIKVATIDYDAGQRIMLTGNGDGRMDYSLSWYNDSDQLIERRQFINAPVNPNIVMSSGTDITKPTVLKVDNEGDGVTDKRYTATSQDNYIVIGGQHEVKFIDWDDQVLSTQTVTHGAMAVAPEQPVRDGYTFTGWDKSFNNVVSNLIVQAQYKVNNDIKYYTVTFKDWDDKLLRIESVPVGTAALAPEAPIRDGYVFTGWDKPFDNVTSNIFVKSVYKAVSDVNHTVKFVDWDGKVLSTVMVQHGKAATAPAEPTRAGHSFSGWDVAFDDVQNDLVVTAQYKPNVYNVKFVDWNNQQIGSVQSVEYGKAAVAHQVPARDGYKFIGWDKMYTIVTGDMTIKAIYKLNETTPADDNTPSNGGDSDDDDDKSSSSKKTVVNKVTQKTDPKKDEKVQIPPQSEWRYRDVSPIAWYYEAVEKLSKLGILKGTGDRLFSPNLAVNRAMLVTVLYRLAGEPAGYTESAFEDVPVGQWYTSAIAWAADKGIVKGYDAKTFGPLDKLTKEQTVAILYRRQKMAGQDVKVENPKANYPDMASVSDYAVQPILWAADKGILRPDDRNNINPQSEVTRALLALMVDMVR